MAHGTDDTRLHRDYLDATRQFAATNKILCARRRQIWPILMTQKVATAVEDVASSTPVADVQLKGFGRLVRVFNVDAIETAEVAG